MISVMTKSTEKIYESRYRTVSILRIRAWILSKSPMCASSQQTCVLTFGAQCIPKVFLASFTAERSHKASWRGAILSKKRLAYGIGWASIHASGTFPVNPNSLLRFRTPVNQAFINKTSGTIIIGKKVMYDFPVTFITIKSLPTCKNLHFWTSGEIGSCIFK